MEFDKEAFLDFAINYGVVQFSTQPLRLKSGRDSHLYINWRAITSDVFLSETIARYVLAFARENDLHADTYYGVPDGGTPLGHATQRANAHCSAAYGPSTHVLTTARKQKKAHGSSIDQAFVGAPKGKVVILEDVTTSGMSLLQALENGLEHGINYIAAITLTNRVQKRSDGAMVDDAVEKLGVPFFSLSTAYDLVPRAFELLRPADNIALKVEEEYSVHGSAPLRLIA